jgi:hypothetical protein
MFQALAATLSDVAWWLQSASQIVPISQLSLVTWLMFLISGLFNSKKAFRAPEQ